MRLEGRPGDAAALLERLEVLRERRQLREHRVPVLDLRVAACEKILGKSEFAADENPKNAIL